MWSRISGSTMQTRERALAKLIETLGLTHVISAGWSFGVYTVLNDLEQDGLENTDALVMIDNHQKFYRHVADYRKEAGLRCIPRDYPNSEVIALGNHMVFYEYPEEFNRTLEAFLEKHNLMEKEV